MRVRRTPGLSLSVAIAIAITLAAAPVAVANDHESQEEYCTAQSGQIVELKPTISPGSDSEVELAGSLNVCQFISQDGDSPTQILVDLNTLHSERPTLAGLAYLAKVPSSDAGAAGSNPASSYCPVDLGGTEAFGTAASGAWVGALDPGMEAGDTDPLGNTVNLCVFADRSAIDSWGLLYNSQGTVRGIDLATVMRYQPGDDSPQVFSGEG